MKNVICKQTTMLIASVLMASLSVVGLRGGNLLVDPGFELQTPGELGGWTPFNGAGYLNDPFYAHSGDWSMMTAAYFGVPGTVEQFPAAPGSKWQLTGYATATFPLFGAPAFGIVQVTFFDILGNDLGTVETSGGPVKAKVSNQVDETTPAGAWQFLDTGIATAPAGTAYVQAFTIYVDFTGFFQGVVFDDLDLEVLGVNHGGYVSSIAHNAGVLKTAGFITDGQAAAMVGIAAKSAGGQ